MNATLTSPVRRRVPAEWYSYLGLVWKGGDPDKPAVEYIAGRRVEKRMGAHETRLANIFDNHLGPFVEANGLGESYVGMEIELPGVGHRRKPDVCFVRRANLPVGTISDAWWKVAPDLAVESISPFELTHATLAKVQEYFAGGVRAVWLILPNVRQVYCYDTPTQVRILTAADTLTGEPVVPGFALPLADLFPPAEPA